MVAHELFEDAEAVEAGHLDVEEDDIVSVEIDQFHGLDTIGSCAYDLDVAGGFEEVLEFLAGEGFVVDDEDA